MKQNPNNVNQTNRRKSILHLINSFANENVNQINHQENKFWFDS